MALPMRVDIPAARTTAATPERCLGVRMDLIIGGGAWVWPLISAEQRGLIEVNRSGGERRSVLVGVRAVENQSRWSAFANLRTG